MAYPFTCQLLPYLTYGKPPFFMKAESVVYDGFKYIWTVKG